MGGRTERTGGSAVPRGMGCGATGAAGAEVVVLSAQNQPILEYRVGDGRAQRGAAKAVITLKG
jgi:hypothetical protein